MKSGIHADIIEDAKVVCTSCSATFIIPSTQKEVHIESCSQCHPVYTGKFRGVASSGRVEKFQKKMAAAQQATDAQKDKKKKKRNMTPEEKLELKLEEARAKKEEEKAKKESKKK